MNRIEAAAARNLPYTDGGAIQPLEMAVSASPALAVVVETPAAATFILTTYDEVYGGWFPRSFAAIAGQGDLSVDELLGVRRHYLSTN